MPVKVDLSPLNIFGACLILVASMFYAMAGSGGSKLVMRSNRGTLAMRLGENGFQATFRNVW